MKKLLLMLLVSLSLSTYRNIETAEEYSTANNIYNSYTYAGSDYIDTNKDNEIKYNLEHNHKRNYNYAYYINSDNYIIKNQDDIKQSLYNGLNDGKDKITLYCSYDDNNDCLNDFYSIYRNKSLMSVINNYVSPFNRYSSLKYRINIKGNNIKIELIINKKYSKEEINEISNAIDNYINKYDLNNMGDFDKIKMAHDYIVDRNIYDESSIYEGRKEAYSAYGAIIGNRAICQGYAEAMAILLDRFNIPNIMISNNHHIWNLVNLDGNWLHLDAAWDDPILNDGSQIKIYDYFLVTTNDLINLDDSNTHNFDSNYYSETLF